MPGCFEEGQGGASVAKGAEPALSESCDGIAATVGGSAICAARAVRAVMTNRGRKFLNSFEYGLTASIATKDIATAIRTARGVQKQWYRQTGGFRGNARLH